MSLSRLMRRYSMKADMLCIVFRRGGTEIVVQQIHEMRIALIVSIS